jgi:hypothetical protein
MNSRVAIEYRFGRWRTSWMNCLGPEAASIPRKFAGVGATLPERFPAFTPQLLFSRTCGPFWPFRRAWADKTSINTANMRYIAAYFLLLATLLVPTLMRHKESGSA